MNKEYCITADVTIQKENYAGYCIVSRAFDLESEETTEYRHAVLTINKVSRRTYELRAAGRTTLVKYQNDEQWREEVGSFVEEVVILNALYQGEYEDVVGVDDAAMEVANNAIWHFKLITP